MEATWFLQELEQRKTMFICCWWLLWIRDPSPTSWLKFLQATWFDFLWIIDLLSMHCISHEINIYSFVLSNFYIEQNNIKNNFPGDLVIFWGFIQQHISILPLCKFSDIAKWKQKWFEKYYSIPGLFFFLQSPWMFSPKQSSWRTNIFVMFVVSQ